ncbi:MAG: response regulator transcription factor [Burkholderiales bacterium]|nr:response regulator transcription factor [Burkholderiales bacterium]
MLQIRQDPTVESQHVFYSASLETPVGLLASFPQVRRIGQGQAEDAEIAILQTATVLWWHLTPGASVAEQFKFIRQRASTAAVVAMSDVPNDLEALAVFSVMAKGYCNTHAGKDVLLKIAQVVESGGLWIGEAIMQRLLNLPVATPLAVAPEVSLPITGSWDAQLTLREREVASAIGLGATNRQIADQMGITERTVKAHVGSVLDKLQIKNRLQLALLVKDR